MTPDFVHAQCEACLEVQPERWERLAGGRSDALRARELRRGGPREVARALWETAQLGISVRESSKIIEFHRRMIKTI